MENQVENKKRKHAYICINFTSYSINEKRYDLRPRLPISKKQKLVEPPSPKRSKKALSVKKKKQKALLDKKKKLKARFKPKVMMDSPFTPPKQESKKKQALCRKALDFGSSSTGSEQKEVFVCTSGGFRLGRKVIPVIRKHKEPDQQKSIVLFSFQFC
ncbi:hypothetical protein Tco_0552806 [Tanacetum coccineum]